MDNAFWHARWEAGQIGFHGDEIHVYLQNFWPRLGLQGNENIFVPLCGKSLDMLWLLEQGHRVLGVEVSPLAVEAFFRENRLAAETTTAAPFTVWRYAEVELLRGDFFDLRAEHLASVDAVYDRASLVALPPAMRARYAAHLTALLPPGTPMLLVTLEYAQEEMDGPPFSVTEAEVRALYEAHFEIKALESRDILDQEPRFRAKGVTRLQERAYRLDRLPPTTT